MVGTKNKLASVNLDTISVAGCRVLVSDKPISNLGVSFNQTMSMASQVRHVISSAYFHLRSIGRVRKMLTVAATKQMVQALVISRLDYCNSLLTGLPDCLWERLEMVQHQAACLIFGKMDRHQPVSVSALMMELHWLPVRWRIQFMVLCLMYKCRHGLGPVYLTNDLVTYSPPHTLQSSDRKFLKEIMTNLKTVGDRAFSAPFNSLTNAVHTW